MKRLKIVGGASIKMTCRLCLSHDVTMDDVFWFSSELGNKIAAVIMECTPVHITRDDKMPTRICQLCFTQLKKFHQFRMQAVRSDRALQRYLQQLNDCQTQTNVQLALKEQSNNSENQNYSADVTTKYEPVEIRDEFGNFYSKEKGLANFSAASKNNEEIYLKSEIKDEPIDNNYFIPKEMANTAETLSMYDGSEIRCEDSKIEVGDTKVECFECPIKFENDMTEKLPQKSEQDHRSQCLENIKEVDCLRSNEDNMNRTELLNKREKNGKSKDFRVVLLKKSTTVTGKSHQCDICQKCFKYASRLNRHYLMHTGEKPYQCNICQTRFRVLGTLKKHNLIHTGEKPYQCDICQTRFRSLGNFKNHTLIHTGEKPYQCNTCQTRFRELGHLKKHVLIHTGEKLYQCHICQTRFRDKRHFKAHNSVHTGEKPYQCDICQMRFRQLRALKQHNLLHTGEKPYRCDICKMCFRRTGHLKNHKLTHTGEKPYRCDICQTRFRALGTLKRHNLIHTGEKPYQCDICQMFFKHKASIRRHKLKIHRRETTPV